MLDIKIVKGIGTGNTKTSAFDDALYNAGVNNFNLIYLSSIIPPSSRVSKIDKFSQQKKDYGKKLYVVKAVCFQKIKDKEAWAGVGWSQGKEKKGIFIEHSAGSKKVLISLIKKSLIDMKKHRDNSLIEENLNIVGIKCTGKPVCAIVLAVYKIEAW